MEKRMRQIIPKLRSKKGMSLVELIVGITILVIVFGATLSAMTNGYSNTIFNADVNKNAVEGGSLNELMAQMVKKQDFADENTCKKYFFGDTVAKDPNSDATNAVHITAQGLFSDIRYVPYSSFPSDAYENQYTIKTDAVYNVKSGAKTYKIKGVEIITSVTNVRGKLTNSSFVAYKNQEK